MLRDAVQPKVSHGVDIAALDVADCWLVDQVAVIDTSREPEWRLKARVVRRLLIFVDVITCRVTIGTVQPADYASLSTVVADLATLQDDVAGTDGNLGTAASVTVVENTVTDAIDGLDELGTWASKLLPLTRAAQWKPRHTSPSRRILCR